MYDFDPTLSFPLGLNIQTLAFIFNICVPIMYLTCLLYFVRRAKKWDKSELYYGFIRALIWFHLFYALGAIYFIWYDFKNFTGR